MILSRSRWYYIFVNKITSRDHYTSDDCKSVYPFMLEIIIKVLVNPNGKTNHRISKDDDAHFRGNNR